MILPLFLAAIGIVASVLGTLFVSVKEGGDPKSGLTRGELTAAVLMLVGSFFAINNLLPGTWATMKDSLVDGKVRFLMIISASIVSMCGRAVSSRPSPCWH